MKANSSASCTNSGGISDEFKRIAGLVQKETGAIIVDDAIPKAGRSLPRRYLHSSITSFGCIRSVAELTFIGAAGTVTGSKHLAHARRRTPPRRLRTLSRHQRVTALNDVPLPIRPSEIDAVDRHPRTSRSRRISAKTHARRLHRTDLTARRRRMAAHADRSRRCGALQQELLQRGFEHHGRYAPPMLLRSTRRRTHDEARSDQSRCILRSTSPGVRKATYTTRDTSSARPSSRFEFEGKRVVFSGDLGRYGRPLLLIPTDRRRDRLVCESTYADQVASARSIDDLQRRTACRDRAWRRDRHSRVCRRTHARHSACRSRPFKRASRRLRTSGPSRQPDGRESRRSFRALS